MSDLWNSLLRVEGLWNSPLRVEILRILATSFFFLLGVVAGRLWAMWRRHRQLKMAERGESQEVVTIEKILLDRRPDGTEALRIRSSGRDPVETVFPNMAARDEFQARAAATTTARPLVSMDGKMGSYLLQELAIWVCGQLRERDFRHDVWVMAPVYERGALYLGGHFLSTVLLIRRDDLLRFRDWDRVRSDSGRARQPWGAHLDLDEHGRGIRTPSRRHRQSPRRRSPVQLRRDHVHP